MIIILLHLLIKLVIVFDKTGSAKVASLLYSENTGTLINVPLR